MKKQVIIFFLFIIVCSSCNHQIKFDKAKWLQKDDVLPSADRNNMLSDLITNHKLIGLKYSQIVELLGEPDFKDSLCYSIIVDYGTNIDPVYTKNLNFTFSMDSIITSFNVQDWKK